MAIEVRDSRPCGCRGDQNYWERLVIDGEASSVTQGLIWFLKLEGGLLYP